MPQAPFCTKLKNRGLIRLGGPDRLTFLQGLITNDARLIGPDHLLYACLLTPQGKFLHDFFLIEHADEILIDCEGGERTMDLEKRLNSYNLRADIYIKHQIENDVFATFGAPHGWPDPRALGMGTRSFTKPALPEAPFEEWDKRRIALTIPDGSRDLIVGTSTLDEANMDELNAVSYDKGCYVGQELTARMHYRGLGKRHLKTINISDAPEGAELRSTCEDLALALIRTTNQQDTSKT